MFAEGQAAVAAAAIARAADAEAGHTYDGRGICYLEFGRDQVAKVEVTFVSGQMPNGKLEGPSSLLAEDKAAFGTDRVRRWFDRSWSLA